MGKMPMLRVGILHDIDDIELHSIFPYPSLTLEIHSPLHKFVV